MAAPGTSGLFIVAMVRHKLRCGEVVDVGNPLGGVWHVSARSVHDGLPEEKGWERQYKSDRLTCPDRIQNRCYSVGISHLQDDARVLNGSLVREDVNDHQDGSVPLCYGEKATAVQGQSPCHKDMPRMHWYNSLGWILGGIFILF